MRRLILAGIAAVAAALPSPAALAGPAAPAVPGEIAVTGGHKPYLIAHAEGVQIYACYCRGGRPRVAAARPARDADRRQRQAARQPLRRPDVGGPRRQHGRRRPRRRACRSTRRAVDWLRLRADSTTAGADGDRLTATTYIQRINTVGGRPPAAGDCDADTVAEQREVPYSADYVFFKATGS